MSNILWQNKTWAIHLKKQNDCPIKPYLMLEKKTTGQCDYPVHHEGRTLYDFPERIPNYVRAQVEKRLPIS